MNQVIIYNVEISDDCPSGVSIDVPSGEVPFEQVLSRVHPKATNVSVVDRTEIPADRYFRNAWQIQDKRVQVDLVRAKALHINNLRPLRDKKLQSLDGDYMKALEQDDKVSQASIALLKKSLRDMPFDSVFDKATTPDDLKNTIPDYLK